MASIEQRLEALEKATNITDKVNVILIRGFGDEPVTRATCGDMAFDINPEETESEFEARIINETEVISYDGKVRVFYMYRSY